MVFLQKSAKLNPWKSTICISSAIVEFHLAPRSNLSAQLLLASSKPIITSSFQKPNALISLFVGQYNSRQRRACQHAPVSTHTEYYTTARVNCDFVLCKNRFDPRLNIGFESFVTSDLRWKPKVDAAQSHAMDDGHHLGCLKDAADLIPIRSFDSKCIEEKIRKNDRKAMKRRKKEL